MVHYSTYTFIMIFSFGVSTSLTFKLLGEHLAAQFVGNGSLRASKAYIQPSGAYHFVPLTSMAYILYLYMFAIRIIIYDDYYEGYIYIRICVHIFLYLQNIYKCLYTCVILGHLPTVLSVQNRCVPGTKRREHIKHIYEWFWFTLTNLILDGQCENLMNKSKS